MVRKTFTPVAGAAVVGLLAFASSPARAQAQEDEVDTAGAAACLTRAKNETFLSDEDAVLLCQGADSDAPVDCYLEASQNTFVEKNQLLRLCSPVFSQPWYRYP